jgi:hypothetical protein
VSFSQAFLCGGRRGWGGRVVTARCDEPGCTTTVDVSTRAAYLEAAAAGWRRDGNDVRCPLHAHQLQLFARVAP